MRPDIRLVYIGQEGDGLGDLPAQDPNIDAVYTVKAGKFRRYNGEGLKQLLDLPTDFKNMRDAVYVVIGLVQSWWLLRKLHPAVLFVKGGFVGVPLGLAAAVLGIPYVTHDSDVLPGLANRIIGRWAVAHAVALPKEVYAYPADKTITVGVPVHEHFQPVTPELQKKFRHGLGLDAYKHVLLVTGGGLGAQRLNDAFLAVLPGILHHHKNLAVVHTVGRNNEAVMRNLYQRWLSPEDLSRVRVEGYLPDLYRYSAAADVIVTRAGATTMAEFATQQKACILVPNPQLTGGHQLKNAAYLARQKAVEIVREEDIAKNTTSLQTAIESLLTDSNARAALRRNLAGFARPDAAKQLAMVLLEQI